jgi:hypothetical protein
MIISGLVDDDDNDSDGVRPISTNESQRQQHFNEKRYSISSSSSSEQRARRESRRIQNCFSSSDATAT